MIVPCCGLELIERFEGLGDGDRTAPAFQPYLCPAGYWTLGWGSIRDAAGARVTRDTPAIDREDADALLARDAGAAAEAAARLSLPRVLDVRQLGALTSFVYNLGAGAYQASILRRRVRAGRDGEAADEFGRWVHARGRVLPGLVRRRAAERALWLNGAKDAVRPARCWSEREDSNLRPPPPEDGALPG